MANSGPPLLEARGIVKTFGGVRALGGVSFRVDAGEVLALCGENGAGKSTLMKVLSGVYPQGDFEGDILWKGSAVAFRGTRDAEAVGIGIIHQELNLFRELTVAENLFAGHLPSLGGALGAKLGLVDWGTVEAQAASVLADLGVTFSPRDRVADLSVGDSQMVEIAKALLKNSKVVIFDEPTSALSNREVERLFGIIDALRAKGTACVYISHKMDEVFRLCDRVVVLRDGKSVGGGPLKRLEPQRPAQVSEASEPATFEAPRSLDGHDVVKLMVGRELSNYYPPRRAPEASATFDLKVDSLSTRRRLDGKVVVDNVSFQARRGEILGLAGMMGSGRSEIFYSLFGHPDYDATGSVSLEGVDAHVTGVDEALEHRIGLVPEDRKHLGLHLGMSIQQNVSMASLFRISRLGVIDAAAELERANRYVRKLRIKAPDAETTVSNLSGGNQQKVALAKWVAIHPRVLLLDEPTRGVDVGAKFEIYQLLNELVDEGVRVIVASSELPELVGICNRVLVLNGGKVAGELEGAGVSPENIMSLAAGAPQSSIGASAAVNASASH
jgi:D-xylose transport system ATP-binding protein